MKATVTSFGISFSASAVAFKDLSSYNLGEINGKACEVIGFVCPYHLFNSTLIQPNLF